MKGVLILKTLVLRNINKIYLINKTKKFYALKDINLSFNNCGFHAIIGKSGSGKTTLLNMIAKLDTPSSGEIFLNKKIYKYKNNKSYLFYQNDLGIIFQQYHLLEDRTALYNVMLPLLIKGYSKKEAEEKALKTLKYVNISSELFEQKCSLLSGGEKQRIAIARAIVKDPKILICDEPTGSLDSTNSIIVLDVLKKISKSKLVIVVSHNLQQIYNYSDRIIEISDGKIINDYCQNQIDGLPEKENKFRKRLSNWTSKFSLSNYKKRIKRNVLVTFSLSISIIMANLVSGFMYGKDKSIRNACYRQLDFGSGSISQEEFVSNSGMLKLVKSVRPDLLTLNKDPYISSIFEICPNFSAILPSNIQISYDDGLIDNLLYTPIYSFEQGYLNSSLLSKGEMPTEDNLSEVVINKYAYKKLYNQIKKSPVGEELSLSHKIDVNYVLENGEYITDTFEYQITSKIVEVVDELDYLSSPKIYYSYMALESYMQEYVLNNLSTYFDTKITWYDRIVNAENYSYLSAYSYQLFLKDYHYRNYLFDVDIFSSDFSFTSSSLIVAESLIGFLDVAKYALILFLAISLLGAIFITSIMSFTNYSEDRKSSAILSSLGAKNGQIEDIYLNESLISSLIATIFSLAVSIPISVLINNIISKRMSLHNLIDIPMMSFLHTPFLYPLLFLTASILIVGVATLIPIMFSKRNSIKGELQNND